MPRKDQQALHEDMVRAGFYHADTMGLLAIQLLTRVVLMDVAISHVNKPQVRVTSGFDVGKVQDTEMLMTNYAGLASLLLREADSALARFTACHVHVNSSM